jgi:lysine N6-hydroxylase
MDMEQFDVVGAGLGPFNLSLAALVEPLPELRARFFEAQPDFRWHCGIMVPGAQLQVSFLKDLVTLVDPSSPFSFLNYLAGEGRLYRFLIAHSDRCSRQEFERYYQWAAGQLKSVRWDHRVERVDLRDGLFEVTCAGAEPVATRNLVVGSGRTPVLPPAAAALHGDTVLHSGELCLVRPALADKDVIVVGAGQSGAEVVSHLLSGDLGLPRSLTWLCSRLGFLPLDDSPFTNEWFHPAYVDHFYGLSGERRRALLDGQRMASDGVSELVDLARDGNRLVASVHDDDTGELETHAADVVICATGYRSEFPAYLDPLRGRLLDGDADSDGNGGMRVRRDYSLDWDGPPDLGIYVQNAAERTHGIADPNLSLAAWRSARIVNAICGRTIYHIEDAEATIAWRGSYFPAALRAEVRTP